MRSGVLALIFGRRRLPDQSPHRALILGCALIATLPLAIRGNSCGHDFDFHIQSWLAVAQSWHRGALYPRWIEYANYAAGEPRLVFYPPISWMFGAILGVVLPWAATPTAFTLIILTACGLSMRKLASQWLPSNAATVAVCAYILNPYALFVAYERTAYAELTAGIWLPLIILYAARNRTKAGAWVSKKEPIAPISDNNCPPERSAQCEVKDLRFAPSSTEVRHPERSAKTGVPGDRSSSLGWEGAQSKDPHLVPPSLETLPLPGIPLALTIAAIWLTNAPAAVMACYTLAAITLWRAITQRNWQPILQSTIGLLLGLGLAAFYLVPAAWERRWVDITRALDPGMRVEDSFLFLHTGQSFHDQVLHTASWIFVTMLATIAIAGAIAYKRKTAQRLIVPIFVTAAVLFALQLRWSDPIWHVAPELKFLQFPWRWSLVLSIAFAIAIGAAATPRPNSPQRLRPYVITILIAAIALAATGSHLFWQPCDDEDAVSAQLSLFHSGTGFEGTDEYTPLNADNSLIPQALPQVRILNAPHAETDAETTPSPTSDDQETPTYTPTPQTQIPAQIQIQQWLPEQKAVTITTQSPGFAILRLMDYPAWQVRANGTPALNRPHRDDGLMTIPIPTGQTRIDITYTPTPDLWWGRGLTATSILAIVALAAYRRKPRGVGYHE